MFSNLGSDANIDWASLAQQWIQRNTKETINETFDAVEAPPPPNISQEYYEKRARNYAGFDEKGEADMDMDDDEMVPPAPAMMPTSPGGTNLMQLPLQAAFGDVDTINQRTDPSAAWNTWMNPMNPLSTQFPKSNPTAHIPSLMKITIPNPNDLTKVEDNPVENTTNTIDAAKRKVLPAWIREGLEKMEREKQKQLEREQQLKERGGEKPAAPPPEVLLATDKTVKDHVVKPLESGDSSGNEQEDDDLPTYKFKNTNKSKQIGNIETTIATGSGVSNDDDDAAAPALFIGKSYEQRLADLMTAVRVTLTQLLLEVTNDEIAQIAKETLKSSKLKASSAQVIRKSALSSITNRLGLAAYSSSDDESDSDNSAASDNETFKDDHRRRGGTTNTTAEDSEEEILSKLRARRRAFAKTTEEIEECIAMNAAREEQKLRYYKQKEQQQKQSNKSDDEDKDTMTAATSSTFSGIGKKNARDFGETTTESKLQQSNGKKSKERGSRRGERTTRFSDNKDSKNVVAVTASYMSQLNSAAATTTPVMPSAIHGFQVATSSAGLTDVNTNLYTPTAAAAAGINSMLSAAEAALEKASKSKNTSTSSSRSKGNDTRDREQRRRRREHSRRHSSDDTDSSSTSNDSTDSSSSTTDTSRDSKYSRASSNSTSRHRHNSHSSSRYHDHYDNQRRNYHKRHRDDYDDRTKSRHSSSSKHSTGHRERSRDRSRSRSTYSSSSSKRHHNRH